MPCKMRSSSRHLALVLFVTFAVFLFSSPVRCAGATTSVHLQKYGADGTLLQERTVDYQWMEQNLGVYGDGETHYYHQGPVFEGDPWDPEETVNLKDKGAAMGSSVRDLCDLVGGMSEGDELMFVGVDGWHTRFAHTSIYDPPQEQGTIVLCWYNGRDGEEGERYGTGYPANNAYSSAMQIVFMADVPNADGKYVFGNDDMRVALPQEEYQYFFEGQFPSTNGLSGKWISEIRIYVGGVPEGVTVSKPPPEEPRSAAQSWAPYVLGLAGLALVGVYFLMRERAK